MLEDDHSASPGLIQSFDEQTVPGLSEERVDCPLVSIVVVTLNGFDLLRRCLKSLESQTYKNIDITVVDNGSTTSVEEKLCKEFPSVRFIRVEENRGFAGGNNIGMREASGEYVALINNDAVADSKWVESMVRTATSDPGIGAVASVVVDGNDPSRLDSCGIGIALDGMSRQAMRGAPLFVSKEPFEVMGFSGCACMLRLSALRETGMFDERFFAYCEDTDLSLRLRRARWNIVVAPEAVVTHFYSQTYGAFSLKKLFWVERNHYWVAVKNFPLMLLVLQPVFNLWRYIVQLGAMVRGKGVVNSFAREAGLGGVIATIIKAHLSMLVGLPAALARRRMRGAKKSAGGAEMCRLIFRFRLSLGELLEGAARGADGGKEDGSQ